MKALTGDRDPRIAPGLDALHDGEWDAVIDLSGYVPRVVQASAALLASRVSRYLFVSSISAYAKLDRPGLDEDAPLAVLETADSEDIPKHYGALKVACEAAVTRAFGARATHVRPGLIVGPHDPTDRFAYWPARFVHPTLLGDRGMQAVVPAPPERPLQFIDARDLATFMLDLLDRDVAGAFNATSPAGRGRSAIWSRPAAAPRHLRPKCSGCRTGRCSTSTSRPGPGCRCGFRRPTRTTQASTAWRRFARRHAGMTLRPLDETVRDTADWLAARDNAGAWKKVLTDGRERQIASAVRRSPVESGL